MQSFCCQLSFSFLFFALLSFQFHNITVFSRELGLCIHLLSDYSKLQWRWRNWLLISRQTSGHQVPSGHVDKHLWLLFPTTTSADFCSLPRKWQKSQETRQGPGSNVDKHLEAWDLRQHRDCCGMGLAGSCSWAILLRLGSPPGSGPEVEASGQWLWAKTSESCHNWVVPI